MSLFDMIANKGKGKFFYIVGKRRGLTEQQLATMLSHSIAIAYVNGSPDRAEMGNLEALVRRCARFDLTREQINNAMEKAICLYNKYGASVIEGAGNDLGNDPNLCALSLKLACLVGTTTQKISFQEGLMLHKLSNELGIPAMGDQYFRILAEAKALANG